MLGEDFRDAVLADPRLEFAEGPRDDRVYIIARNEAGLTLRWELIFETILEHRWYELLGVMLGERRPDIMIQVSRIVGYFSMLRGWNRSKLAELAERHKGNYVVAESAA